MEKIGELRIDGRVSIVSFSPCRVTEGLAMKSINRYCLLFQGERLWDLGVKFRALSTVRVEISLVFAAKAFPFSS